MESNSGRIIIVGGTGKINTLLNLINHQPYIDKIYIYANDPYEAKYQLIIHKYISVTLKHCDNPKVIFNYFNNRDDIYKNLGEYNPNKRQNLLNVFDYITADMFSKRNFNL